ncbi:UDP-glycosyltransferase 87A1-like [Eucalyptus grandis]|uniref:UDP-glycosyltransferase 87A1-like n=1 Tax=Eucalyptus grandis TaxID=71139 RepID=UPI0008A0DE2C|nr:UDP-glycosyltransferase 87A1-like [Eucalyptus grandis]
MKLVVPWCEHLSVLCHASAGGFWSHCRWSSTSEAIVAGLPLLTFPIYWNQVSNSKLVVEDWRIGWRIKRKEGVEYMGPREEIAGLVWRFMDLEDEEAKAMRMRAKKLQEITGNTVLKGGSSDSSIDAFARNLLH